MCNLCTLSLPLKEIQSHSCVTGLSQPRYVKLNLVAIRLEELKKGGGDERVKGKNKVKHIFGIRSAASPVRKEKERREGRQTERQVTSSPHHSSPLIAAYYGATIVSYGPR